MAEFFYNIVIKKKKNKKKTIMAIMDIIQERGVDITVKTLMDKDMVLFAFYRTLLDGTNLFIQ